MTGKHSKVCLIIVNFKFRGVHVRDQGALKDTVNASRLAFFVAKTASVATVKTLMDRLIEEFYSTVPRQSTGSPLSLVLECLYLLMLGYSRQYSDKPQTQYSNKALLRILKTSHKLRWETLEAAHL